MKKIVCALFALAVVLTAVNFAAAEEKAVPASQTAPAVVVAPADGCPCAGPVVPYRLGLFGHHYRPVVAAPVVVAPAPIPAAVIASPCSGPTVYRRGLFGHYYYPVLPRYVTF
ncbi:MAG: hypothetical protein LBN39_06150 [Planctomycetaceae bacterium]|jgi:hypothetical protein|nr:hypothetical protein [Planctomycetaceae bacterium]